jgi:putative flavoprotein involved in K+ transport
MTEHYSVIVVGAGQAGLSASYHLKQRGIEHLVVEKRSPGYSWREERWDSFCLVTPNWQCQLPGYAYAGADPDGFMKKDEILGYLDEYLAKVTPPLRTGVSVSRVRKDPNGAYQLQTSAGAFTADCVVVAAGAYHRPIVPEFAKGLSPAVTQVHSRDYKNPEQLPKGAVLVVGSGQSGCQIAEDLHFAGRQVHLCLGDAPRSPRVYRGKDVVAWLHEMGYYDTPVESHPDVDGTRDKTNHYLTGRDGGREIDLRKLALEGMQLYGHLRNTEGVKCTIAPDLRAALDGADAVYLGIRKLVDAYIEKTGQAVAPESPYVPLWEPEVEHTELDLEAAGVTSVVWSIGFRSDFRFVELPVFDGRGYPRHQRGVCQEPGLYFLGLPWLHTWGSGRMSGVGRDAEHVVQHIAETYLAPAAPRSVRARTAYA